MVGRRWVGNWSGSLPGGIEDKGHSNDIYIIGLIVF